MSRAADLWALGRVAFLLLTGERLWRGASAFDIVESIKSQRVTPPDELVRSVPPAVSQLVLSLLEKAHRQRLASAEKAAAAVP